MSSYGWVNDPAAVEEVYRSLPFPVFADAAPHLMSQSDDGGDILLYKAWREVTADRDYPRYPAQEIGDCVSQGFAHGVDLLAAVEIALGKEAESYKETSTEAVYGVARVEVGGGRLGNSDGAVGAWAAKAVTEHGTISREAVGAYSGRRAVVGEIFPAQNPKSSETPVPVPSSSGPKPPTERALRLGSGGGRPAAIKVEYRKTDMFGMTWTDSDPANLERWIAWRNSLWGGEVYCPPGGT